MFDLISIQMAGDCTFSILRWHSAEDDSHWDITTIAGKGKGFEGRTKRADHIFFKSDTLLIPCQRSVANRINDFLDLQRSLSTMTDRSIGPYYFSIDMTPLHAFAPSSGDRLFGGPFTAYDKPEMVTPYSLMFNFDRAGKGPPSHNAAEIPLGRSNCWTAAQGITQYVGGVDLGLVDAKVPHFYRVKNAHSWLNDLAYKRLSRPVHEYIEDNDRWSMLRLPGAPPFMLIKNLFHLGTLLASPVRLDDREATLDSHLRRMANEKTLFAPMPLDRHRHRSALSPTPS